MAFDYNIVEYIKSRCNIVDIVGQVVELKKTGSNYKGCCPFHNEKTPSFVVSDSKQIYTCFGCGETGDIFQFVQKQYNLSFTEALERLATQCGIEYKKNKKSEDKQKYYDANVVVAKYFVNNFWNTENSGRQYMLKRGIRPETLRKFGIGYADASWDSLYKFLKSKNIEEKVIEELGLVSKSKGKTFDKFRNRVMFPIFDARGRVIGFGGRAIGDDIPKYLNSPESIVFLKKNNLYGLNFAKKDVENENHIILVEGYMDVISLYQKGITNVSASLGTALTENQIKLIKRYTKNIILSYDSDEAGKKAALRGIDLIDEQDVKAKILTVSEGKDPDEFIQKNGREKFLELVKNSMPSVEYKIYLEKQNINTDTFEGSIEFLNKVANILTPLKPIECDMYANKIAEEMNIAPSTIKKAVEENKNKENNNYQSRALGIKSSDSFIEKDNLDKSQDFKKITLENLKISALDKTIIKLILSGKCYFDKMWENIKYIKSPFVIRILSKINENTEIHNWVDIKDLKDIFDEFDLKIIKKIDEDIYLGSNIDEILNDCVNKIKVKYLEERKKILLLKLSMADEEENNDSIFEISQELQEIQKILKNRS